MFFNLCAICWYYQWFISLEDCVWLPDALPSPKELNSFLVQSWLMLADGNLSLTPIFFIVLFPKQVSLYIWFLYQNQVVFLYRILLLSLIQNQNMTSTVQRPSVRQNLLLQLLPLRIITLLDGESHQNESFTLGSRQITVTKVICLILSLISER